MQKAGYHRKSASSDTEQQEGKSSRGRSFITTTAGSSGRGSHTADSVGGWIRLHRCHRRSCRSRCKRKGGFRRRCPCRRPYRRPCCRLHFAETCHNPHRTAVVVVIGMRSWVAGWEEQVVVSRRSAGWTSEALRWWCLAKPLCRMIWAMHVAGCVAQRRAC
jgi:hypothetical protein